MFWENGIFSKNCDIQLNLAFSDLWRSQYWPERKNDSILSNVCTHWEQSNAFSRAFLALLVFELGGVIILTSTPGRRWPGPPPGRGMGYTPMSFQRPLRHCWADRSKGSTGLKKLCAAELKKGFHSIWGFFKTTGIGGTRFPQAHYWPLWSQAWR